MTDFNNNWRFRKADEQQWQTVNIPHDAMLYEKRDADCHNGINSGYFPGGCYEYEKVFTLSEADCKQSITVLFEAVYQDAKVFLNGKEVGCHKYGYTEFRIDLTGLVIPGENTLTVLVDNSLEPNCRWYSGSGIFRPVHLIIRGKNAPKLLKIRTVSIAPAQVEVVTEIGNTITILDGDKAVLTQTVEKPVTILTILEAKFWDENTPNLYQCRVENDSGELTQTFGIRSLTWDAKNGMRVNGKRVLLRGGCIHHDNGVLGACEYRDAAFRRVKILKEQGFNALRIAHNPASRDLLDACDHLGMYVMDESFDGWFTPKTYHDYARIFDKCWRDDLTAMVEKDYNHPCVIMYSVGNEVSETTSEKGVQVCGELRKFVNKLDSTRPVTAGINVLLNVYTNMGMGVYKDQGTYEAKPLPPKQKGYKEKATGSAFFNMMAMKLGGLMFYMSAGKKGDKASRGAAENLDIIGLNYASSRYDADAAKYPERMMVGSETMVADLPYNWERVKKYPQLVGDFVWSAWDYLGEACIGDWTYHSYKGLPKLAGQGMIDITGKPLATMAFMQTVWGQRSAPFIGVSPLNHWNETPSAGSWQFTNAIDNWTWHGYEGKKANIEVYSDADSVRLELNGNAIGTKKLKKFRAVFKAVYAPGTLTAVALDAAGKEISHSSLVTGDKEKQLTIKPEFYDELTFLPIEFTDRAGDLLPYVEQMVSVKVEGCELLGFGSALCKTDEKFISSTYTSYRGRLLAVVRGHGTVTASSDGVPSVTVNV